MSITEQIKEIIEPYICFSRDGKEELYDSQVIIDIKELFCSQNVTYQINENHCDCGPGYEQSYYVFSWIKDGELYTYDILLEWY